MYKQQFTVLGRVYEFFLTKLNFFLLQYFYTYAVYRAVTKISSCQVNTTSRWEIKQLGISFGSIFLLFSQPPPQALRFLQSRGATGDEPQGTIGRVQTAGKATSRPLSPSRLPLRVHFHRERDIWVRGSYFPMKVAGGHVLSSWGKSPAPPAF